MKLLPLLLLLVACVDETPETAYESHCPEFAAALDSMLANGISIRHEPPVGVVDHTTCIEMYVVARSRAAFDSMAAGGGTAYIPPDTSRR